MWSFSIQENQLSLCLWSCQSYHNLSTFKRHQRTLDIFVPIFQRRWDTEVTRLLYPTMFLSIFYDSGSHRTEKPYFSTIFNCSASAFMRIIQTPTGWIQAVRIAYKNTSTSPGSSVDIIACLSLSGIWNRNTKVLQTTPITVPVNTQNKFREIYNKILTKIVCLTKRKVERKANVVVNWTPSERLDIWYIKTFGKKGTLVVTENRLCDFVVNEKYWDCSGQAAKSVLNYSCTKSDSYWATCHWIRRAMWQNDFQIKVPSETRVANPNRAAHRLTQKEHHNWQKICGIN